MKEYSFLQEFVGTAIFGGLTALSALGLNRTIQNNSFNNKYVNFMIKELNMCPPNDRNKAEQIVKKYTYQLSQIYNKVDKKTAKKINQFHAHIQSNYMIPMMNIIRNNSDPNWKQTLINYVTKNFSKIKNKNRLNTAIQATSLAASGAGLAGIQGATAITSAIFTVRNISDQLKFFNGQTYIRKMQKELQQCPDNDRNLAAQIVENYCFNISKYIESQAAKSGKQIPFNIQQKMRVEFLQPLMNIIKNPNARYWKVQVLDYISENRIQQSVSHVANTVAFFILPKALSKYGSNVKNTSDNVKTIRNSIGQVIKH